MNNIFFKVLMLRVEQYTIVYVENIMIFTYIFIFFEQSRATHRTLKNISLIDEVKKQKLNNQPMGAPSLCS